jgi:hypothetical protein
MVSGVSVGCTCGPKSAKTMSDSTAASAPTPRQIQGDARTDEKISAAPQMICADVPSAAAGPRPKPTESTMRNGSEVSIAAFRNGSDRAGPVARLAELHAQELFLACALARGDPQALRVFEERYLAHLGPALSRLTGPSSLADDVRSHLRESFLVGTPERGARIADYAGRGELLRWLKAAAVRAGLNLLERHGKEQLEADPVLSALSVPAPDPELEALRARHAGVFQQALCARRWPRSTPRTGCSCGSTTRTRWAWSSWAVSTRSPGAPSPAGWPG